MPAAGYPLELLPILPLNAVGFARMARGLLALPRAFLRALELLRRLDELSALGRPVLVGVSRKSTLGRIVGDASATTGTLAGSLAAAVAAFERGASMIRAHDVRETVEALAVAAAVERGRITA